MDSFDFSLDMPSVVVASVLPSSSIFLKSHTRAQDFEQKCHGLLFEVTNGLEIVSQSCGVDLSSLVSLSINSTVPHSSHLIAVP